MHVMLRKRVIKPIKQARGDVAVRLLLAAAEHQSRASKAALPHGAGGRIGLVAELLCGLEDSGAGLCAISGGGSPQHIADRGDRHAGTTGDFLDRNTHSRKRLITLLMLNHHVITCQEKCKNVMQNPPAW